MALWTAKNVGIYVPENVIVKACNWLLRTQESAGGWAYQPAAPGDPYSDFGEYANHNSAPSMAAAGLGSLYITAGMLQFVSTEPVKEVVKKKSVSAILKVKEESEKLTPVTNSDNNRCRWRPGQGWSQEGRWVVLSQWSFCQMQLFCWGGVLQRDEPLPLLLLLRI